MNCFLLRGERQFPAHLLQRICVLLSNYEALDFLESQVGRAAARAARCCEYKGCYNLGKSSSYGIKAFLCWLLLLDGY